MSDFRAALASRLRSVPTDAHQQAAEARPVVVEPVGCTPEAVLLIRRAGVGDEARERLIGDRAVAVPAFERRDGFRQHGADLAVSDRVEEDRGDGIDEGDEREEKQRHHQHEA